MAKYELDEKGILTIVSESDGGITSVAFWSKKISTIVMLVALVSVAILYIALYNHDTDLSILEDIFSQKIINLEISSNFVVIQNSIKQSYSTRAVMEKIKEQIGFMIRENISIEYKTSSYPFVVIAEKIKGTIGFSLKEIIESKSRDMFYLFICVADKAKGQFVLYSGYYRSFAGKAKQLTSIVQEIVRTLFSGRIRG